MSFVIFENGNEIETEGPKEGRREEKTGEKPETFYVSEVRLVWNEWMNEQSVLAMLFKMKASR